MSQRRTIFGRTLPDESPLDVLAEALTTNDLTVYRIAPEELVVDIDAEWSVYRLNVVWIEEAGILQIYVTSDLDVGALKDKSMGELYKLLQMINERVMVGHFEVASDTQAVTYRNSSFLTLCTHQGGDFMEQLISFAIGECERFYPTFQLVMLAGKTADDAVSMSMIDTIGEA